MMRSESPYTDNAGRPIRERDTIEAKYGYRYTVSRSGPRRLDGGRLHRT